MRVAIYARVSTTRQAQQQTIEQQRERLVAHVGEQGWSLREGHVFRDDGYSGSVLARPGLDRLRDAARNRELDRILVTAPDRRRGITCSRWCSSRNSRVPVARSTSSTVP